MSTLEKRPQLRSFFVLNVTKPLKVCLNNKDENKEYGKVKI